MSIKISTAPASWGVDDPKNPYLPPWKQVLNEASTAGYKGIELGPYGYLPLDVDTVKNEMEQNNLHMIAGTIFDNLVDPANLPNLKKQTHDICSLITKLPLPEAEEGQKFSAPYLVIIDWGHDERDYASGHPEKAPRLSEDEWKTMINHITELATIAKEEYGVRSVIHPHAGGYIEFADEIEGIVRDIPYDLAGLCLDTGHLYYSKMDPIEWLRKYSDNLDYIHFKDLDKKVYDQVMGEKIRFFEAVAKGVMCPLGEGIIPYPEIRKLLDEIKYSGYVTVEQERDPRDSGSSLDDVTKSLRYLQSIGY